MSSTLQTHLPFVGSPITMDVSAEESNQNYRAEGCDVVPVDHPRGTTSVYDEAEEMQFIKVHTPLSSSLSSTSPPKQKKKRKRYNRKCCFRSCKNHNLMEGLSFHRIPPPQGVLPPNAHTSRHITRARKSINRELILERCHKLDDVNRHKKDLRICDQHEFKREKIVRSVCINGNPVELDLYLNLPCELNEKSSADGECSNSSKAPTVNNQSLPHHQRGSDTTKHGIENVASAPTPLTLSSPPQTLDGTLTDQNKPIFQNTTHLSSISTSQLHTNELMPLDLISNWQNTTTCQIATKHSTAPTLTSTSTSTSHPGNSATTAICDTTETNIATSQNPPCNNNRLNDTTISCSANSTLPSELQNEKPPVRVYETTVGPATKKRRKRSWNYKCCFGTCRNTNNDNVKFHRIPPKQTKELPPDASTSRHITRIKKNLHRKLLIERCGHFERDKEKIDIRICDAHDFKEETVKVNADIKGKDKELTFELLLPSIQRRIFSIKTAKDTMAPGYKKEGHFFKIAEKRKTQKKKHNK